MNEFVAVKTSFYFVVGFEFGDGAEAGDPPANISTASQHRVRIARNCEVPAIAEWRPNYASDFDHPARWREVCIGHVPRQYGLVNANDLRAHARPARQIAHASHPFALATLSASKASPTTVSSPKYTNLLIAQPTQE